MLNQVEPTNSNLSFLSPILGTKKKDKHTDENFTASLKLDFCKFSLTLLKAVLNF